MGERRYTLGAMLDQDAGAAVDWLRSPRLRSAALRAARRPVGGHDPRHWWARRAARATPVPRGGYKRCLPRLLSRAGPRGGCRLKIWASWPRPGWLTPSGGRAMCGVENGIKAARRASAHQRRLVFHGSAGSRQPYELGRIPGTMGVVRTRNVTTQIRNPGLAGQANLTIEWTGCASTSPAVSGTSSTDEDRPRPRRDGCGQLVAAQP